MGASGSPICDINGRLVAIHHYGAKNQNQAVPFGMISRALLEGEHATLFEADGSDTSPPHSFTGYSPRIPSEEEPVASGGASLVLSGTTRDLYDLMPDRPEDSATSHTSNEGNETASVPTQDESQGDEPARRPDRRRHSEKKQSTEHGPTGTSLFSLVACSTPLVIILVWRALVSYPSQEAISLFGFRLFSTQTATLVAASPLLSGLLALAETRWPRLRGSTPFQLVEGPSLRLRGIFSITLFSTASLLVAVSNQAFSIQLISGSDEVFVQSQPDLAVSLLGVSDEKTGFTIRREGRNRLGIKRMPGTISILIRDRYNLTTLEAFTVKPQLVGVTLERLEISPRDDLKTSNRREAEKAHSWKWQPELTPLEVSRLECMKRLFPWPRERPGWIQTSPFSLSIVGRLSFSRQVLTQGVTPDGLGWGIWWMKDICEIGCNREISFFPPDVSTVFEAAEWQAEPKEEIRRFLRAIENDKEIIKEWQTTGFATGRWEYVELTDYRIWILKYPIDLSLPSGEIVGQTWDAVKIHAQPKGLPGSHLSYTDDHFVVAPALDDVCRDQYEKEQRELNSHR